MLKQVQSLAIKIIDNDSKLEKEQNDKIKDEREEKEKQRQRKKAPSLYLCSNLYPKERKRNIKEKEERCATR